MPLSPEIYWLKKAVPARLAILPRPRAGDWLADEVAAWAYEGISTIVSLLELQEVRELDLVDEPHQCAIQGIEFLSYPIPDRGTPKSISQTAALINELVLRLNAGAGVAVHCRAGIGRSGLITGCILLKLGIPQSEVFPAITAARGVQVPDTAAQAQWLELFEREITHVR